MIAIKQLENKLLVKKLCSTIKLQNKCFYYYLLSKNNWVVRTLRKYFQLLKVSLMIIICLFDIKACGT